MVAIHPSNMNKPGIRTLGKQYAFEKQKKQWQREREAEARRLRQECIEHNQFRILKVLEVFAKYPTKTGRIDAAEFWAFEDAYFKMNPHPTSGEMARRDYGFIRAVARIFLNCKTDVQCSSNVDWILFLREVDVPTVPAGWDHV